MQREWALLRVRGATLRRVKALQEVFTKWDRQKGVMPLPGRHTKVSADEVINRLINAYGMG